MRSMIFILGLMLVLSGFCQTSDRPIEEYLPTENLDMRKDANKASNRPKRKNYSLIYVPDANKIMYGNSCVTQQTHKMGFEYIVEPKNGFESKSRKGKFLNNLWVKTKLVFTRSPFWKLILNKKIKNCRRQSGDFVG